MNPNIPSKCNACDEPLLLENLFVEDGCPCNSPLGVNFEPKQCAACGLPCSRPGHRVRSLFGIGVVLVLEPRVRDELVFDDEGDSYA